MGRKGMLPAAVILTALAAAVMLSRGNMPYRDLKPSDIVSAAVQLSPPDETVLIEEPDELVSLLREVVLYYEDNSYPEYTGQAVTFTLTMADGSQEEITAYAPFVIINGTGYQAKYQPCEQLSRYANQLLNAG